MIFFRHLRDYAVSSLSRTFRLLVTIAATTFAIFSSIALNFTGASFAVRATLVAIGWAFTLISFNFLVKDWRAWRTSSRHYEPDDSASARLLRAKNEIGFTATRVKNNIYSQNASINQIVNATNNPLEPSEQTYSLPQFLEEFSPAALAERRPTENEEKIRLTTDLTECLEKRNSNYSSED